MRRNLSWSLDGLDPDTREAARQAAARAGTSLEDWLRSTISDRAARAFAGPAEADELDKAIAKLNDLARGRDRERPEAGDAAQQTGSARTAAALDSFARWIERAEDRLGENSRLAAEDRERATAMLGEALSLVARRFDDIERKLSDGGRPSMAAALKAVEAVERIERTLARSDEARGRGDGIDAALHGFGERIAKIGDTIGDRVGGPLPVAPRPAVPRGSGAREDITAAIAEIRSRQKELANGAATARLPGLKPDAPGSRSHSDILLSLKGDIANLAGQLESVRTPAEPADAPASALRADIERLQGSIAGLATRDEVSALEASVRELAGYVRQAQGPGDLASVTRPMEALQAEVCRLSEAVSAGAQGDIARQIGDLARKVDGMTGGADPNLASDLGEMRRMLAGLAEPRQVERLAEQVADLSRQVAQLSGRQLDALEFAALKSAVEDIRTVVKAPAKSADPREGRDLARQVDALSGKLDTLIARAPGESIAVTGELQRLASRLDGAILAGGSTEAVEPLLERFDRLDRSLRQTDSRSDLTSIEAMLRSLADKLDGAGRPDAGRDALDALERQVSELARKLDRGAGQDPALAGLERSLSDLMTQVETLRDGAQEAAERAARTAIASTLSALPKQDPAARSDLGVLERELGAFKAHQSQSDKRTHDALEAVHATLEKVAARLAGLEQDLAGHTRQDARQEPRHEARQEPRPARDGKQPSQRTAAPADRAEEPARVVQPPAQPRAGAADRPTATARLDEILLEPGAERPRAGVRPSAAATEAGDVKANFIAAARRAAQAAAAEAAAAKTKGARSPDALLAEIGTGDDGLAIRLKRTLDKHRRPILLGLAALVLALGTLKIIGIGGEEPRTAASIAPSRIEAPAALPAEAAKPAEAATAVEAPARIAPAGDGLDARPAEPAAPLAPPAAAPSGERDTAPAKPTADSKPALPGAADAKPATRADAEPAASPALPPAATAAQLAAVAEPPSLTGSLAQSALARIPDMATVELPANAGPAGLRRAVLAGDPAAVYDLASKASEGQGMTRDLKLAARLCEKAAAAGLAPAQYRIGNQYEKGLGVPRDLALATAWYRRAAEKGNARAMHNLAVLLAQGAGAKPDYAAAAEWFRRAADYGVHDSQFNLAVLLARGLGVQQDLVQSYTWFGVAAAQGDDDAGKKRDEVGARLGTADLATARAAVANWHQKTLDQAANEVALPANGWSDVPPKRPSHKA